MTKLDEIELAQTLITIAKNINDLAKVMTAQAENILPAASKILENIELNYFREEKR